MALPSPVKGPAQAPKRNADQEIMTPKQIDAFMKKHGYDDKYFAEFLGVTVQAVWLWLSGDRKFSATNSRLLKLLDKHPNLQREF